VSDGDQLRIHAWRWRSNVDKHSVDPECAMKHAADEHLPDERVAIARAHTIDLPDAIEPVERPVAPINRRARDLSARAASDLAAHDPIAPDRVGARAARSILIGQEFGSVAWWPPQNGSRDITGVYRS
jgi:hypothetical protein